jgi:salicylate hydroxylase
LQVFQNTLYVPKLLAYHLNRKAKDVKLYKLLFRAPLPTWHKSRLVIIGDAAHPMLPCKPSLFTSSRFGRTSAHSYPTVQGQAGAQAIEDGAALGVVFSEFSATDPTSISNQLQHFENIRRNRASVMQMISNAGQDEADKVRESVLPYMPTGKIPSA